MAQLSNDCFETGARLMPLDEALALIAARLVPVVGVETVPLADALGRVLAEDVAAGLDVPPHDNAAVDGYAVYFDDLKRGRPTRLRVTGRAAAGHPLARPARRGEAVRVFTGAPMPRGDGDDGPDTVMMQEDCRIDGDVVAIAPGIERGANRRRAGEDLRRGQLALARGRRLRPEDLGLAASVGRRTLEVYASLRAAVFSTGDEVREPGEALPPGAIYDANRAAIRAQLAGFGCRVGDLGILPDDRAALTLALAEAAHGSDLLVTSGGVSVGEEDHVKAAVEALGRLSFWRLAIKPGRPVALGQIDDRGRAVPFVGLPGNPVAVMVTLLRLVRPLVLRLAGAADTAPALFPVRAGFAMQKKPGRREFVRCRLERDARRRLVAVKAGRQGAGILSAVAAADGLVELGEEMAYVRRGTVVDFLPFSEVR
jgi:molybdopterin molybdotransferase